MDRIVAKCVLAGNALILLSWSAAFGSTPTVVKASPSRWYSDFVAATGEAALGTEVTLSRGSRGFSDEGGREDFGFESEQISQDFRFKVGVFDSVTFFGSAPYLYRNLMSLDARAFRSSSLYQGRLESLSGGAATALISTGVCSSTTSCQRLISANYAPLVDVPFVLANGESMTLPAGVPVVDALDAVIVGGMTPESGQVGFGDLEVGFAYEILTFKGAGAGTGGDGESESLPMGLSIAPYARIPLNRFEDLPVSQRPTGSGTTVAGLATAFDLGLERHTVLGLVYELESEVAAGRRKASSYRNSAVLRDLPAETYSQTGLGQKASLRLAYDLAGFSDCLGGFGIKARYVFQGLSGVSMGKIVTSRASTLQTLGGDLDYVGHLMGLPWSAGVNYSLPIYGSGEDMPVAPWQLGMHLEVSVRM